MTENSEFEARILDMKSSEEEGFVTFLVNKDVNMADILATIEFLQPGQDGVKTKSAVIRSLIDECGVLNKGVIVFENDSKISDNGNIFIGSVLSIRGETTFRDIGSALLDYFGGDELRASTAMFDAVKRKIDKGIDSSYLIEIKNSNEMNDATDESIRIDMEILKSEINLE